MTETIAEQTLVLGTPKDVWPLLTQAKHFQAWYAFGGAEIDLRPGGAMVLRWDEHGVFDAVVDEVIPQRRFSFRWKYESEPGPLVTIAVKEENQLSTRIEIVESGDLEDPEQSALAWRNALSLLQNLARTELA